jgi:hypothetical protein
MWSKVGFASWNLLFLQMGPRWAGSGSEPWPPQPTPWSTAAPGGAGREGGALHRPYLQRTHVRTAALGAVARGACLFAQMHWIKNKPKQKHALRPSAWLSLAPPAPRPADQLCYLDGA